MTYKHLLLAVVIDVLVIVLPLKFDLDYMKSWFESQITDKTRLFSHVFIEIYNKLTSNKHEYGGSCYVSRAALPTADHAGPERDE